MINTGATGPRVRIWWVVRVVVSLAVLAIIFVVLPLQDVLSTIRRIDLRDWFLALGVFLVGHVVSAAKWSLLIDAGTGFRAVLKAHFAGLVANLSLPGVAGGDVVRAAVLYPRSKDKARLALGSLVDRVIDTIGLLLIAGCGLLIALHDVQSGPRLLAWVGTLLVVFCSGGFLAVRYHRVVFGWLPATGWVRWVSERLSATTVVMARQKGRLLLCLALSIVVQSAFIATTIGLARAAGVAAPIAAWFFAWPLSKLIATLPISIAGIGIREASLAGFLAPFGASAAAVVGIGLLWQSIQLAGGLFGGLVLLAADRAIAQPARRIP